MSSKRPLLEQAALERLSTIETEGLISRRELMRRGSLFGAAATLSTFSGVLGAAGQSGGGKVVVGLDSGAFTPILKTFAPEFKAATGIEVDFQSYPLGNMYDQNMLALRQTQARFDAFDFWPNFTGDFGPYLTPLRGGRQARRARLRRRGAAVPAPQHLRGQDRRHHDRRRHVHQHLPHRPFRGTRPRPSPSRRSSATTWLRPRPISNTATPPSSSPGRIRRSTVSSRSRASSSMPSSSTSWCSSARRRAGATANCSTPT